MEVSQLVDANTNPDASDGADGNQQYRKHCARDAGGQKTTAPICSGGNSFASHGPDNRLPESHYHSWSAFYCRSHLVAVFGEREATRALLGTLHYFRASTVVHRHLQQAFAI
jgi:hypothetical protein